MFWFWFGLFMTPGLSKDILCHVLTILFLNVQITGSDIRPHIKWVVSLVIAYGHFNLPQGFVWACMYVVNILTLSRQRLILVVWPSLETCTELKYILRSDSESFLFQSLTEIAKQQMEAHGCKDFFIKKADRDIKQGIL